MRTRRTTLALLAAATLVAAGCSNNDRPDPPSAPMNAAPMLGAIANVTTNQDTVTGPVEFSVTDDSTPAGQIMVTAAVDGDTPIPADGVTLGGTGAMRTITVTPLEAATGTSNVTVTAVDAQGLRTMRSFSITLNARNASVRDAVVSTFAKSDAADATTLNGFTFTQDADEPGTFDALLGNP
jgi:hypothetical protein